MEFTESVTTLYRRCTMSPSEARNTSSPCSRNARRVPFAPVAVPKNFKSIGGGGGGPGGGGGGPGATFAVLTGAIGFGISTGTELLEKIFRPPPVYTSDSVTSIAAIRNVGSSCAQVVAQFIRAVDPRPKLQHHHQPHPCSHLLPAQPRSYPCPPFPPDSASKSSAAAAP